MAIGDVFELTLHGQLQGQSVDNVFTFEQRVAYVSTLPSPAHDLSLGFINQYMPKIRAVSGVELVYKEVRVKNLFNASDAVVTPISLAGTLAPEGNDMAASFNAIGIKLEGDDPAVKSGAKRFGGVLDLYQTDGILDAGTGMTTALTNLCNQLETPVKSEPLLASDLFDHVITKRVRSGAPGNYTYRMPASPAEKVVSVVLVALWDVYVTSQISRKVGIGA